MAAAWLLGRHDLPSVALIVNSLADAGTAVLLCWLGRRLAACWVVAVAAGLPGLFRR